MPLASLPPAMHHWIKSGYIFLISSSQILGAAVRCLWSHLCSSPGWTSPAPSASSGRQVRDLSSPAMLVVLCWAPSALFPAFWHWETSNGSCGGRIITSLDVLALFKQSGVLLAFFPARAHCWLVHGHLTAHQDPQVLFMTHSPPCPSPACVTSMSSSYPGAGLCICPSWISEGSCWPFPPYHWGPSEWQSCPWSPLRLLPPANLTKLHEVRTLHLPWLVLVLLRVAEPAISPVWSNIWYFMVSHPLLSPLTFMPRRK